MRLLEVFLLLELKDRLTHIAEVMGKKIINRWRKHVEEAGLAGLPREWQDAYNQTILPMAAFGKIGWSKDNDDPPEVRQQRAVKWIVEWFASMDPTKNKKYTDWIIRQWLNEKLWLEDAAKIPGILETFEEHKNNLKKLDITSGDEDYRNDFKDAPVPPPERRADLNSWKDYRLLARVLRPLTGTQAAGEKVSNFLKKPEIQDMMNWPVPDPVQAFGEDGEFDLEEIIAAHDESYMDRDYDDDGPDTSDFDTMNWYDYMMGHEDTEATTAIKPIYQSDRLAVLQPNSRAAACELGKGTEWCTSSTESENYFWRYAPDGPLYVVLTDKMGKFQFHFETGQFANVHDEMLSPEEQERLVSVYPELKEIFGIKAITHGESWLVDPSTVTVDKIKDALKTSDDIKSIWALVQEWDGKAPEETLEYLEQSVRKRAPEIAWAYLRNPHEQDFLAGIDAIIGTPALGAVSRLMNLYKVAQEKGVQLDDKWVEAGIKADGRVLLQISPERINQNPDWVIEAVESYPGMLIPAAQDVIQRRDRPEGSAARSSTHEVHKAIINALLKHPKGPQLVNRIAKERYMVAPALLDAFGMKPWKFAFWAAHGSESQMTDLARTIAAYPMPNMDWNGLLSFLLEYGIYHKETILAIEKAMGGLPIEIQQAMLNKSPAFIDFMQQPDPQLKAEAERILNLDVKSFRDLRKPFWTSAHGASLDDLKQLDTFAWMDRDGNR